ncbi:MAG: hypothetical protein ICV69_10490 [Thermoleophilaceae bacterium]|nr:hypothetical protein [Thermoleophilaceae bacterium]
MQRGRLEAAARRSLPLAIALLTLPAAAAAAPVYPDLVADPPGKPSAPEVYSDAGGARLLLRFDGFVHNRGPGPLEIQASSRNGTSMASVRQRFPDGGGSVFEPVTARVIYETDDSHDHWHLKHIARYSLWTSGGTAEVGPAQKVGFCLVDSERREPGGPGSPVYTVEGNRFCEQDRPYASGVTMGVSAGWRDVYDSSLAFQWVDISDVPPGLYRLRAEIDPEGRILEGPNEANPPAWGTEDALVPGYVADNVSDPAAEGARWVHLAATPFGVMTRAPQFKIVTPPQHGTLDKPVGEWFSGAAVRYAPAAGYWGPDSFTFAARDPTSSFPRNPPAAVATLTTPAPAPAPPAPAPAPPAAAPAPLVAIAGAPESLPTGASAQLNAVVENDFAAVTWSVDGVVGGDDRVGTVSPTGLYQAPAEVPPAGHVRVAARSPSGGAAEAVIRIVEAPVPRPAPDVPGEVRHSPREGSGRARNPLSPLRVVRHHDRLLVSLTSASPGRVVVRARRGGRRIGGCSARISANQRMTCAIKLDRPTIRVAFVCRLPGTSRLRRQRVRVSATLYVKGRRDAVRRARVRC